MKNSKRKIWIVTLFPEYFEPFLSYGVISKAFDSKDSKASLNFVQLRDFTKNSYKGVDDSPYGGGPGMVMRADILEKALLDGVVGAGGYSVTNFRDQLDIINFSPRGARWSSVKAREFANNYFIKNNVIDKDIVFICGRYEGIDERFISEYVDDEISIGDYVLSGAELAVQIILDSSLRFVPGVVGNEDSFRDESFENDGLLDYPVYTRPQHFKQREVPPVLLSGNHKEIDTYRLKEQIRITKKLRPDLYNQYEKKNKRG